MPTSTTAWDAPVQLPQGTKPFRRRLVSEAGVSVLLERLEPNTWGEHSHPQWQVALLFGDAKGTAHWTSRDGASERLSLEGGQVWILPPQTPHRLDWAQEDDAVVVYVHPVRAPGLPLLNSSAIVELSRLMAWEPMIADLCQDLRQFCSRPPAQSATRIAQAAAMLACLAIEGEHALATAGTGEAVGRSDQVVVEVNRRVSASLKEDLSMAELASAIGVSPRHFRRLYRRATGLTPQEYLWSRRTSHAKNLLASGAFNVSEAAIESGFADASHMNRHFRAVFGVPPSVFLPRRRPE